MAHQLAIITVVYRNYTTLKDFFESLSKQTSKDFKVFIFDGSPEKKNLSLPEYTHLIQGTNHGYAHGVNKAFSVASEMYSSFAVVNSDIIFEKHFVERTLKSLEKNQNTLIGGKIYYAPDYEYHKTRYSTQDKGRVLWYAGGYIDWHHALAQHRGIDEVDRGQYNSKEPTSFITGCLICYTKQTAHKLGKWSTSYNMYFEDADYCQKAKKKKVALVYDPSIIIWHKNAQSSGGSGSTSQQKMFDKSRLLFGLRFAPFRTKLHLFKNKVFK